MLSKIKILGINITNESENAISEYVFEQVRNKKKCFIITPNPEIMVYASKHPSFKNMLNEANVALPDGVGLTWASRLLNKPLHSRITGVDFMETLCKASREKPLSMGFLGGKGGVAERAVKCLKKKYPWIKVVWVGEEWSEEKGWVKEIEKDIVRYSSGQTQIDMLFVAFGFPKQEEWIAKHLTELPVTAGMGVGGAFDYLSGDVKRAPAFIRRIGFEWLFRLILQPWRIKRQLSLLTFVFLVLKEFLAYSKDSRKRPKS